jgi:hypothetical protein
MFAIKRAMKENPNLTVTLPNLTDEKMIDELFEKIQEKWLI